jgi:hypothetical protein
VKRLLVLALFATAAVAAIDPFKTYGLEPEQWQNALVSVARGSYSPPQIPASLRALGGPERAAVVEALGAFARTYTASNDFKKRHDKLWKEQNGGGGGGFGLGGLKRKMKEAATGAAKDAVTGGSEPGNAPEDRWKVSKDVNQTLRRRLTYFLEVSSDVDFDAKVEGGRFVDAADEARAPEWKMCYRAGKDATVAARGVAEAWLKDLPEPAAK